MLGLTNNKLRRPYSSATTFDLGCWLTAKPPVRRPSVPLVPRAHSSPLPVVYITSPIQHTLDHFLCFLCSATFAETPWYIPTSNILSELSGDATAMSKAAKVLQSQLITRMSAGRILELFCPHPQPTSRCADKPVR